MARGVKNGGRGKTQTRIGPTFWWGVGSTKRPLHVTHEYSGAVKAISQCIFGSLIIGSGLRTGLGMNLPQTTKRTRIVGNHGCWLPTMQINASVQGHADREPSGLCVPYKTIPITITIFVKAVSVFSKTCFLSVILTAAGVFRSAIQETG